MSSYRRMKTDKARLVPTYSNLITCPRLDQLPGFIPLKTGDPIPPELRQALNVEAYVYELRKIAQEVVESELEP